MKSTPSKRLRLTWSEKVGILDKAARTPALSYRGLAEWAATEFSLPAAPGKTTICRIIKSSAVLLGRPLEKDQGIIHCIKRHILSRKMMQALDRLGEGLDNPYEVDQLTALLWCEDAWSKVSASTIRHCWNHSGRVGKAALPFIFK
ncbi:hypothetical protein PHYSODRAFT_535091 [Phytophthora sojae]|uniref:DDE-1 domain-containing protein n=1 Tax=Phytophthora sojae (strain P6497) TaxID=1094619 RepID=G5AHF7_PHYSP|nr:hypothetical protein PHYSODRAFT_534886 [Phytophthora sojae]XP_009539628.1 hypothetical protein PHYSODRAFT_535091 [Phytophthora sojae]EGZ04998.1 hypothetical protein PHYSODRAFT_535091 [Phytophthora sojae]EGZ04999.1 hypothetical protein PHYSODRAFT_534886 [Phytophthora sojae]|eukprot:XP_009539508.1 hypothetical protein PHYSODRAFT_534886 [Phytophthora sojae]